MRDLHRGRGRHDIGAKLHATLDRSIVDGSRSGVRVCGCPRVHHGDHASAHPGETRGDDGHHDQHRYFAR